MYKVSWTSAVFKDAEIVKTRVQINSEDNLTIITKILDGNHTQKSEDELIFLVLEQFYQDTYPNRAENEKFSKVDEKLKLVDTKLAELDKVKKELDITQGSLMDLITQVGGGALAETENQNKGGENNDGNVIRN
jgi:hypothetical protein|nr:MAG TPA: Protein of unknown function (DUF1366) [Caudoviricetes sp.]